MPGASTKPTTLATVVSKAGVAADQLGARETVLQIADEGVGIVAEENGADAPAARGDQDRTQRALADGEADFGIGAAGTPGGGRHAEHLVGCLVEAAAGVEPRIVDGLGHRHALSDKPLADPAGPLCRARRPLGVSPVTGLKTRWK